MRAAMRRLPVLLLLALSSACVHAPRASQPDSVRQLQAELVALPGAIAPEDAARLAAGAFDAAASLHARYRPLSPPHLGNLAFHLGLRERALCCHWAEDLLRELSSLELPSVSLHWGVAHLGSALREHSAVIAVPRGGAFEQGMVLDGWRHSGRLFYVRADQDRYPWRPHPSDLARDRLACGASR